MRREEGRDRTEQNRRRIDRIRASERARPSHRLLHRRPRRQSIGGNVEEEEEGNTTYLTSRVNSPELI